MKPYVSSFFFAAALTGAASAQTNFPSGVTLGPTGSNSGIYPFSPSPGFNSVEFSAYDGALLLYSPQEELLRGNFDGGVTAYGNPVNIVLSTDDDSSNFDRGVFSVWRGSQYFGGPNAKPLFSIASPSQVATFEGVNVVINNGTLTVAGSTALTQANSTGYLSGQGFLQTSGLSSALTGITPPTSSTWTNTYVPRGTISNGAALALGTSVASSTYAIASGTSTTVASGAYSQAHGVASVASGAYAHASGNTAVAEGLFSVATGLQVTAKSASETVFGRFSLMSSPTSISSISGLDGLLRLGNGTGTTTRSDAMTVLKSGETTLTNKEWKTAVTANPATRFDDPASTTDSGGNALVVDGHARLRGKVLIQPQGDLSMGSFTAGEAP